MSKASLFRVAMVMAVVAGCGDNLPTDDRSPAGDDDDGIPNPGPGPDVDASVPPVDAPDDLPPPPPPPPPPPLVSFANEIRPILLARCGGCHLKDTGGAGGLALGASGQLAYAALVDQPSTRTACPTLKRVDSTSADPMRSILYLKLVGTDCGNRMPVGAAATPLDDVQVELFARWISEGAKDN